MIVVTLLCDMCNEFQPCIVIRSKPWAVCSECDTDEFNRLLNYDPTELPKIRQPSKGER